MTTNDLIHRQLVDQHVRLLGNLQGLLRKAGTVATARKFPQQALTLDRLAPDMHPLTVQVRIACDIARGGAARLGGKTASEAPALGDSVESLCAYAQHTIDFLRTLRPEDFAGAAAQRVTFPWLPGKALAGMDYFFEFVIPNVHFHVAAVYMLLRTNGLEVGKTDFLGQMSYVDA